MSCEGDALAHDVEAARTMTACFWGGAVTLAHALSASTREKLCATAAELLAQALALASTPE